jgi:hypothetical protein
MMSSYYVAKCGKKVSDTVYKIRTLKARELFCARAS